MGRSQSPLIGACVPTHAQLIREEDQFNNNQQDMLNSIAIHKSVVTNTWLASDGGLTMAGVDEVGYCDRAAKAIVGANSTNEMEDVMEKWLPTVYW